jgi:hypothetical protein
MGYRSDVRIRTTKEGYEVMKKFVENYVKEKELKGTDWNLLEHAIKTEMEGIITLDWNYMKWYEGIDGYEDVNAIMKSLDELSERDIDYQYMRIGEEKDDIDERWNINNDSFSSFYVNRFFEG